MEIFGWLRYALYLFPTPLLETPLIIGLILFAATWIWRNPWVTLPQDQRRRTFLIHLGIWAPLGIIAVAITAGAIAAYAGYDSSGSAGWWRRPAPIAATALAVGIGALCLAREPLPAPGERAILPRRHWWSFVPTGRLWTACTAAALLALTAIWQGFTTSLLPGGAELMSQTTGDGGQILTPVSPGEHALPQGPFTDVPAGGGWVNHGATLLVLGALIALLILTLSRDANRPMPARSTAPNVTETREVTAKLFLTLTLGGIVISLGMLWMYLGYLAGWQVIVDVSNQPAPGEASEALGAISITPDFAAFAAPLRYGGWLLQGVGVALLLRTATDTWRAARRSANATPAQAQGPSAGATATLQSEVAR